MTAALALALPPGVALGERLTGGNTNDVYSARWNDRDVIVRVYGSHPIDRDSELQAMRALADSGVCPRVLHEFDAGRIEEMARGETPEPEDARKPALLEGIARAMAELHCTRVPGAAAEPQLWPRLHSWAERAAGLAVCGEALKGTGAEDLRAEAARLRERFDAAGGASFEVGFCHNDLNTPNLLIDGERVTLIDFEYAGTNYVAFDVANFFNELGYSYKVSGPPGFRLCPPPTDEEKRRFASAYLRRRRGGGASEADVAALLRQATFMSAASHLLWTCWSVCRLEGAAVEDTAFDFAGYARHRLGGYRAALAAVVVVEA